MAVSIHTPSGNINTVSRNTAEIGVHTHTPSGYINTVPTNLTRMLSDNLNNYAINKYTNTLGDDSNMVNLYAQ